MRGGHSRSASPGRSTAGRTNGGGGGGGGGNIRNRPLLPFARHVVTLSTFKAWLVRKGCNEDLLSSLLEHVKVVVGRMRRGCRRDFSKPTASDRNGRTNGSRHSRGRGAKESGKRKVRIDAPRSDGDGDSSSDEDGDGDDDGDGDLHILNGRRLQPQQLASRRVFASMSSLEDVTTLGSPKLWQYAVLASAGISPAKYRKELSMLALPGATPSSALPNIVHYLMIDGEKYLPAAWRASEEGCKPDRADSDDEDDEDGASNSDSDNSSSSSESEEDSPGAGVSVLSREDEEEECALRLYHQHRAWEGNEGIAAPVLPSAAAGLSISNTAGAGGYLDQPDSDEEDTGKRHASSLSRPTDSSSRRGGRPWRREER